MTDKPTAAAKREPTYQPSKAELEADVSLDATLGEVVKAVVSGGAEKRKADNG